MRGRRIIVLVLAVTLCGLVTQAAVAHPWTDWHTTRWQTGTVGGIANDRNVEWRFVSNFPTADGGRTATKDASKAWNGRSTLTFDYEFGLADWSSLGWGTGPCSGGYQRNKVGWMSIGASGFSTGEPLGQNWNCYILNSSGSPLGLHNFLMRANSDAPFWKWSGDPPSDRYDLQGLMTHEFGHATGRDKGGDGDGHFVEGSSVCPPWGTTGARHTMCPSLDRGIKWWRSIEAHDVDVLQDAY